MYNSDGGNAINESNNEDKFFKWVVADEDKSFYTACQKNAKTFIRFFGGTIEMQPATPFRNNDSGLWKFTVGDLFFEHASIGTCWHHFGSIAREVS